MSILIPPAPESARREPDIQTRDPYRPDLRRSPLALWSADHRWAVLLTSVVTLAAALWLMMSVGITTADFEDSLQGDSKKAAELMGADFGEAPTEMVIVTDPDGPLAGQELVTLGTELATAYQGVDGVAAVGTPFPGQDGSLVLPVELTADAEGEAVDVSGVSAATLEVAADHPDLTVGQFGNASLNAEVDEQLGDDFLRAELIAIPITLLVLLAAFGAVVAAGVPLALGLGSVGVALGLTALVSAGIVPVDQNSQSLVLLIGLAVGVDYALFVLRRAREERAAGATVRDSIGIAGATAGRAVVVSGLTVVVAMSGMLVAGGMFASMGIGAMIVVGVAVVAAVTTLPALLSVLGDKVEWLRLPFTRRRTARAGSPDSAWGRLAAAVTRRPLAWAAVSAAVLLALAAPALSMKTSLGGLETLPQDLPGIQAYHQLEKAVPSDGEALTFVASVPAGAADEVEAVLLGAADELTAVRHVTGTAPEARVSTDGTVLTWDVGIDVNGSDDQLPVLVDEVREDVLPQVRAELADVPGAEVYLAGSAMNVDMTDWMDGRLPWVVGFVLTLTLVVMALAFGSLSLAAATVALNLLSVGAAYGILELVFGGSTWAEGLLGFTTTGTVAAWLPLMLFVMLFGLSMDYHVFVVSRVREARDAGASTTDAIRYGVARSAGVVTAAALVMVGVFSVFGTLSMLEMKQMGVGLAAAILLDATLVRGVLLPSVLALLGEGAHTGPRWLPHLKH
ncbi:MMPL family transporter [Ornithinimicrobium tianjinense]|uniref:Membrane protein n=1 Tax=Ornithinimicrobium tianjinense TaxID=1195761 RepID=A0A917BJ92_9MICO|nr:MMPL family transporter [Ornithinimicrobium tianjinense]GGF41837.1 membrane protein [Ornithinimicrobium tianjinense]